MCTVGFRIGKVAVANTAMITFYLSAGMNGPLYFAQTLRWADNTGTSFCTAQMLGSVETCEVERTAIAISIEVPEIVPTAICSSVLIFFVSAQTGQRAAGGPPPTRLPDGGCRSYHFRRHPLTHCSNRLSVSVRVAARESGPTVGLIKNKWKCMLGEKGWRAGRHLLSWPWVARDEDYARHVQEGSQGSCLATVDVPTCCGCDDGASPCSPTACIHVTRSQTPEFQAAVSQSIQSRWGATESIPGFTVEGVSEGRAKPRPSQPRTEATACTSVFEGDGWAFVLHNGLEDLYIALVTDVRDACGVITEDITGVARTVFAPFLQLHTKPGCPQMLS